MKRDPARLRRIREVVRVLIRRDAVDEYGTQTKLARHFGLTRQRVNQIVREERGAAARASED